MSKNIILTIGVPIYNEEKYIEKTLISLEKIKFDEIEILISDNNSTDRSKEIIKEFENRLVNFRFLEHSNNIGASLNMQSIFENASGKYVWLIGGGEVVYSQKINVLLDICKNQLYSNIALNHDSFDEINQKLTKSKKSKNLVLDGKNNPKFCYNLQIAGNIVDKKLWLEQKSNFSPYWHHIEIIFSIFFSENYNKTINLGDKYYILNQNVENAWYSSPNLYKVHFDHLKIIKEKAELKNSKSFRELYLKLLLAETIDTIIYARLNGLKEIENTLVKELKPLLPNNFYLFIYFPFIYFPIKFINRWKIRRLYNIPLNVITKFIWFYFRSYAKV